LHSVSVYLKLWVQFLLNSAHRQVNHLRNVCAKLVILLFKAEDMKIRVTKVFLRFAETR
jgi:hypothetical protein